MIILYEIQYVDGFGAWRRWSTATTIPAAEAKRARCEAFLRPAVLSGMNLPEPFVRVVLRSA